MTYEQAYADHCYLWTTHGPAQDMTGAYVDQDDLALLLKSPTKRTAKNCLERQIMHWFDMGPDLGGPSMRGDVDWSDPVVCEIAERHGISTP